MFTKNQFLTLFGRLEKLLAVGVLVVTVVYAVLGLEQLTTLDWQLASTYFAGLEFVLQVVIGIELARLLIDYSVEALVELLAFVVARKLLIPNYGPAEVFMLVIVLFLLFAMRMLFIKEADRAADILKD